MPKLDGLCLVCGAAISYYPSQPRKFCSRTCFGVAQSGREMPVKPRTGSYQPCKQCHQPMWVRKHAVGRKMFCSKACFDAWQGRNRVVKDCSVCGKRFTVSPSQSVFRGSERLCCSNRCMGIASIKRPLDRVHNGKPVVLNGDGYVWIWEPDHPEAWRYKGWMAEHRIVAESALGRRLTRGDEVHHVNRIKDDNRPENLSVLDGQTHSVITAQQRMSDREMLNEYIRRYGPLDSGAFVP